MLKRYFIPLILSVALTACQKSEGPIIEPPSGLPALRIHTEGGNEIGREDYVPADFSFYAKDNAEEAIWENVVGKIRGRGNSTWDMVKKPYKLKFDNEIDFFDMQAQKIWVLLANYADKTLVRNYLAYQLADNIGLPFSPSYHFIEVYVNDKHQGNYMFTDQTEVNPGRVEIPELSPSDNDPDVITGGYLLEIDTRVPDKGKPYFETETFPIRIRSPKEPSTQQMNYISEYVKEAEGVLFGEHFEDPEQGFRKYFDEESMIRWFLVSEVFKNVDSKEFSSIFFHKNRDGKLVMGPLWDFDLSAGNAMHCESCMDPKGWYVLHHPWFHRMYDDEGFKKKVRDMWKEYKPVIEQTIPSLDHITAELSTSQQNNFKLWPDFSDPNWAVKPGLPSYKSHVDFLRSFLQTRIEWMDEQFREE